MIESYYWKKDLLLYAKKFRPVPKPPRWTEKLMVNFEKDVIVSFFMIRKLNESGKFSLSTVSHKARVFRYPAIRNVHYRNYTDIYETYDHSKEEEVFRDIIFISNQLIHGGAIFAYREKDRNWGGIYTSSDFERSKYIYRIPLSEITYTLELAGNDHPARIRWEYCDKKKDIVIVPA